MFWITESLSSCEGQVPAGSPSPFIILAVAGELIVQAAVSVLAVAKKY